MVRSLFTLLLMLIIFDGLSQNVLDKNANDPFLQINFNRVVLYDIEESELNKNSSIVSNWKINSEIVKETKPILNVEMSILCSILKDTSSYGQGTTSNFVPNVGVVFFLDNAIVGYIDLSLDCNYLKSSFYISPMNYHNELLEEGNRITSNIGFSKKGRRLLKKFLDDLMMSESYLNKQTVFD